jgi:hypothetical protein
VLQEGRILKRIELPVPPVSEGMAIANGKLYLTTKDGRLVCFYDNVLIDADSDVVGLEDRTDGITKRNVRNLFNWEKEEKLSKAEKTNFSSKLPVGVPLAKSKDPAKISEKNTFEPVVPQRNEQEEFERTTSSSDFTSGRFKEYTMVKDDVFPDVKEERNNLAEENIISSSQKLESKEIATNGIYFGLGFMIVFAFILLFASRNWVKFILHFLKRRGMVGSAHSTFSTGRLASCFRRNDREESRNNSFTVRKEEKENESEN